MPTTTPDLRYPIGKFAWPESPTQDQIDGWITDVERTPAALRAAVNNLTPARIETPYRPGGWTVRQTVHHVADSHLNAYTRLKLALTEDSPTIKPYEEGAWAELDDTRTVPIEVSLTLVDSLHIRWVAVLRSMTQEQMLRDFIHPERGRSVRLDSALAMYAWHGKHHVAHITALREREGW